MDGHTATFTSESYGPQDRLLSVQYPDCETVSTRYDASGQPVELTGSDVYIAEATGKRAEVRPLGELAEPWAALLVWGWPTSGRSG